ncbi:hypothetical protein GH733_000390 [Mirounga leonina]|nr:hypothetical protein GH733_000390 [Mirounga leonina]
MKGFGKGLQGAEGEERVAETCIYTPQPSRPLFSPRGPRLVRKDGADRGLFFTIRSPGAQAAYLAIPTLLKARASRSGETSGVLEDRKSRRFGQREQNRRRLGGGLYPERQNPGRIHLQPTCARGAGHMARCGDTTRCPRKIRWTEERPLEARGGGGHAPSWPRPRPRPPVRAAVGRRASSPWTGDSAPGEGDGASRGRSPFSTASAAPCVPTRTSESLTQSRARIASPPTTRPETAEK